MIAQVDQAIAHKVSEIKALPYAKSIVSEDVIERNFGYKIIRHQVSHGKNSVIYKCETVKHAEVYCLVKPYKMGRDKVKQSLREETCQIMKFVSMKCAQLISTYDIYYTNEKIYLMCDWSTRGELLAAIKAKSIRLNEQMLRNWAIDIMSAVAFLHNNAICHRNIAPNSLLLTNENRVKLGTLSDAVIYCKPDGTVIKFKWVKFSRTLNWNQAPEVAKNRAYDPRRADVWSIGATIFWFVCRTYPIDYRSRSQMTKQLETKLAMIRKVTSRCRKFIQKMLTYQPSERPTVAQAQEHEWITLLPSGVKEGSTAKTPEQTVEIVAHEKTETTGEATGPEEAPTEPETSVQAKEEQTANNEVNANEGAAE